MGKGKSLPIVALCLVTGPGLLYAAWLTSPEPARVHLRTSGHGFYTEIRVRVSGNRWLGGAHHTSQMFQGTALVASVQGSLDNAQFRSFQELASANSLKQIELVSGSPYPPAAKRAGAECTTEVLQTVATIRSALLREAGFK